jgi:hypothetical protein
MADKESGAEQPKTKITGMDRIVKEGPANYFRGLSTVGGKLTLTDTQLIFKPGMLDLRRSIESIAVKDIVAVERRNILFVLRIGFGVVLSSGETHRFVVFGREDWVDAVVKVRSKIRPPRKTA